MLRPAVGEALATYRCAACGAVNRLPAPETGRTSCLRCRRELDLSGRPQPVDAAALASAILCSPAPVLVDFSGSGPTPPEFLSQAGALAGEVLVLHVDLRAEPAAAEAYHVGAIPTLVLFAEGTELARRDGPSWPDLPAAVAAPRPGPRAPPR
jgi:thioredoxin 2